MAWPGVAVFAAMTMSESYSLHDFILDALCLAPRESQKVNEQIRLVVYMEKPKYCTMKTRPDA
jgi:hypothetical protein